MDSRRRLLGGHYTSPSAATPARAGVSLRNGGTAGFAAVRPAVLGLARLCLIPLASAAPLGIFSRDGSANVLEGDEDLPKDPGDPSLWIYISVAMALVLLGGAFAGLTIALMGQDETYLQVIATSGEGAERKHASKVLNLLKKGKHWVLVTLLLSNVITNETLPIVLDRSLGGGWPAVLSSTVLIVIFGEIAPQSVCVRYGLSIGAFCAPGVLCLMWIMFPVAWPTAKLLDYLLGEDHGTMYKKAGLKTLVQLHKTLGTMPNERLMEDEANIINSVLDLKDKPVCDVMTPMQDVFTMSADTVLDERMMDVILSQGYSRIPVYAPDNSRNFIGMLLVKILITYDPEDCMRVRDFALATLPETSPYTSCLDIINFFQEGKSHMVLVSDFPGTDKGALGVVTLEDVIEELIGEEIIDESDVFVDVHKAIRRLAPAEQKRYRLGKAGKLEEIDDEAAHEGHDDEHAPLLSKTESRKSSVTVNGTQTPATTFMMRRKSSNASEPNTKPMPLRSNNPDLRQHLKHLGPSNVASKPKPTKYTSVKIKPGVSTIPENQAANGTNGQGQIPRRHSDVEPSVTHTSADESTSLLKKATDNASGGAAAVQASYGTHAEVASSRPRGSSEPERPMSAAEASQQAREHTSPGPESRKPASPKAEERSARPEYLQVPEKMVIGSSQDEDQVGDLRATSPGGSRSRRPARSGSITETTVDVDGVKKMVLDTHSSSDESPTTTNEASRSTSNLLGAFQGDGSRDEHSRETSPEKGGSGSNANGQQSGDAKKKKKKRGGKKKH
ncbi:DUF21-domain-containing protein [Hortaea werneckii]|nr:DUF21-domain-containing protein [Hortaea werneckii]